MRILAISPRIPAKEMRGYQILAYKRLEYLSKRHLIYLICFDGGADDYLAKKNLEALGISVKIIKQNRIEYYLNFIKAIFDFQKPIQCAMFESSNFKNAIQHAANEFEPNFIYAISVRIFENYKLKKYPLVLDMIDSLALNFARRVDQARGIYKILLKIELARINKYEKKCAEFSSIAFVVSSIDKNIINSDKVNVLPLGVDVPDLSNNEFIDSKPVILFTGNMYYEPNINAVMWFYDNCWGRLSALFPAVSFVIAGSNPAPVLLSLCKDKAITVTGYINSMTAAIKSSQVCIAPMQSGSGMQFKILEAMACEVPVVTTSLGLGDIGAINGVNIIVADTPEMFVTVLSELLTDADHRARIGSAGLSYVKEFHQWNAINTAFERLLLEKFDYIDQKNPF